MPAPDPKKVKLNPRFYEELREKDTVAFEAAKESFYRTLKLDQPLVRSIQLKREAVNVADRTVTFSFSSEEPVERWFGDEILGHDPGECDLSRMEASAAYLVNHDWDEQVGAVLPGSTRLENGKGYTTVKVSRSQQGEDLLQDQVDGIRPNVSVGYFVSEFKEVTPPTATAQDPRVFRAVNWTPYEVSSVSVPADISVGVGRQADPIPTATRKETPTMTPEEIAAQERAKADAAAANQRQLEENRVQARTEENARVSELLALEETYPKHEAIRVLTRKALKEGLKMDDVRKQALDVLKSSQEKVETAGSRGNQPNYKSGDLKDYSILRAVRLQAEGRSLDGLEGEVHQEEVRIGNTVRNGGFKVPLARIVSSQRASAIAAGQRTMNTNSGSAGGYLVETTNVGMVDLLRNKAVLPKLGVTMLEGLIGDISFARQTGAATGYWVGQSKDMTLSDQTLGQLLLSPKTFGAATRLTRKLMMQSSPSAEIMTQNDLLKVIGLGLDLAAINGSGVAGQPLGLLNISGIGSVVGTALGYAGILEFESDLATANADEGTMKFLTTPIVRALLKGRQRFTSTDSPLWDKDNTVNGYGALSSNQVPASTAIFADWSQLILALWGTLELKVADQGSGYLAGDVDLIAFQDCDIALKQTGAVSVATGVN